MARRPRGAPPAALALLLAAACGAARAEWRYETLPLPLARLSRAERPGAGRGGDLAARGLEAPHPTVGQRCAAQGFAGGEGVVYAYFDASGAQGLDVTRATLRVGLRRLDGGAQRVAVAAAAAVAAGAPAGAALAWEARPARLEPLGAIELGGQQRGAWVARELEVTAALREHTATGGESGLGFELRVPDELCWTRAAAAGESHADAAMRPLLVVEHRLDVEAPRTRLARAPAEHANASAAEFVFDAADDASGVARFLCALDGGAEEECTSPARYEDLADGAHTFRVRAVDAAGNAEPREKAPTHAWAVKTRGPTATLTAQPTARSNATTAKFVWEAEGEASVACRADGGGWVKCESPYVLSRLGDGEHSFEVRLTDAAGNEATLGPLRWEVDLPPTVALALVGARSAGGSVVGGEVGVRFEWSEPVQGFDASKVLLAGVGGTLAGWRTLDHGAKYECVVHPAGDGMLSVHVAAGAASDAGGNANARESNRLMLTYDGTPPTASLAAPAGAQADAFELVVTFSEVVRGMSPRSVQVLEGKAALSGTFTEQTSASRFKVRVAPAVSSGARLLLGLRAGAASDTAGNPSLAAESIEVAVSNGNVYVAEPSERRVAILSESHTRLGEIAVLGVPSSVEVDEAGMVYVGDAEAGVVRMFDGADDHANAGMLTGLDGVVAVEEHEGELFVARRGAEGATVVRLDADGDTVGSYAAADLFEPVAVEADAHGRVLVCDAGSATVHVLRAADMSVTDVLGGGDAGELKRPVAVDTDGAGNVYVADAAAARVAVYHGANLTYAGALGEGRLSQPAGVEVDRLGRLLVTDAVAGRLVVFDAWPGAEVLASVGGLASPTAVGALRDERAPRCSLFGPEGEVTGAFDFTVVCDEPLQGMRPAAIEVGGAGGDVLWLEEEDGGAAMRYTGRVEPAALGELTLRVAPGVAADRSGNALLRAEPDTLRVTYYGGQCSAELGCSWQLAQYEHQLAERRLETQADLERRLATDRSAEEEAAARRLEAVKAEGARARAATELEAKKALAGVEVDTAKARAGAEAEAAVRAAEGKARAEADEAIRLATETEVMETERAVAAAKAQGEAQRAAIVEATREVLAAVAAGARALVDDPIAMRTVLGALATLAAAYFAAREVARALANALQAWLLGKPKLLRETSRGEWLRRPWAPLLRALRPPAPCAVLSPPVERRLQTLAKGARAARARRAPLRHVLMHGPPGTGKTMAALQLARSAGLDYAVMTGGDVAPMGKEAVTEIHALFAWAQRSRRGVVLFIDEADAFLRCRTSAGVEAEAMSEGVRAALNALLYCTGGQSASVMLVLASNRPEDLDSAVLDRMDEAVLFDLPAEAERAAILRQQLDAFFPPAASRGAMVRLGRRLAGVAEPPLLRVGDADIQAAAAATEGFSGRALGKLVAAAQAASYSREDESEEAVLDAPTLRAAVDAKRAEMRNRGAFLRGVSGAAQASSTATTVPPSVANVAAAPSERANGKRASRAHGA